MRRLVRLLTIVWTFWRLGVVQGLLAHAPLASLRWMGRVLPSGVAGLSRGQRLRLALEALGPIFVKFGQVLSTRRDLVPLDIAEELALLQDRVPPIDSGLAAQLVERALGRPLEEVFEQFQADPEASASIAQVHFATLKAQPRDASLAGREVAVKVLRPGMLDVIESDLSLLHTLAGWVERLSADGRRLKPREVVAEFDTYLHDELDLVREAANATQLRRNMEGLGLVMVPEMIWDLCTTEVIVMERMNGVPIGQVQRLRDAGIDFKKLARDGVTIFFTQVFRDGFFHADMHPGNIQVSLAPETFGRYIALDFGIIGTLSERDKDYLAQNFIAFFRRDYKRVAELHVESGWVPPNTRVEALESAIRAVCEPQFERPLKDISLGQVLLRLFQTSRRFNVEIQPQLVLLQKTLLNIEGLGRELDPDLDLWSTAKPFLERWMSEQVGWRALWAGLKAEAPRLAHVLPALPRLTHQALTALATQGMNPASGSSAPATSAEILALMREQRRTNRLLQGLIWSALGFVLGTVVIQVWWRLDFL